MRKAFFVLSLLAMACTGQQEQSPNIIILFTDDQSYHTIHAWGNTDIHTPSMDRLAEEGMSFRHTHVMGSIHGAVCAPSRAMLLSGRTFFDIPSGFYGGSGPSELSFASMPEVFREQGYNTFFTGKWHNPTYLINQAFSHADNVYIGGMHWPEDGGHDTPLLQPYDSSGIYPNSRKQKVDAFSSQAYTDAVLKFISQHGQEEHPFLAYVAYTSPHDPRMAPEQYAQMYTPESIRLPENFLPQHPFDNGDLRVRDELLLPFPRTEEAIRTEIAAYYAMVSEVDAQIGRILDELDHRGMRDNTIVVFAGDNGLAVGQHGLLGKQSLYEHSSRVPLIIRGPGVPASATTSSLTYLYDIFPTLCDISGVTPPHTIQGKSLVPLMMDPTKDLRDHIFTAYKNNQRAVKDTANKKLIKYSVNGALHTQLFDLDQDPWETHNLYLDPHYNDDYERLSDMMVQDIMSYDSDPFLSPMIHVTHTAIGRPPRVSITRSFESVKIYMTMDGSQPNTRSKEYIEPFVVDSSFQLSVQAYYKGRPVSAVVSSKVRIIDWLKDAKIISAPTRHYDRPGPYNLIDNNRGTMDHDDGSWLAWQDKDMHVILDLGQTRQLASLTLGVLEKPGSWIFAPEQVTFEISDDGLSWDQLGVINVELPPKDRAANSRSIGMEVSASGRYIRVLAKPLSTLPDWHPGAGSPGWLYVDEIIVEPR